MDPHDLHDHIHAQLEKAGYGLPPVMTVAETAQFLRVGRSKLYEELRSNPRFGGLYFRWGSAYRIRRDKLLTMIEGTDDE
jgi:hypothetical protein